MFGNQGKRRALSILRVLVSVCSLSSQVAVALDVTRYVDREALDRRSFGEDPSTFAQELTSALELIDHRAQPEIYLTLMSNLANLSDKKGDSPLFRREFATAKRLAKTRHDVFASCILEAWDVMYLTQQPEKRSQIYASCSEEATKLKQHYVAAIFKAYLSNDQSMRGDSNSALMTINEALDLVRETSVKDSFAAFLVKTQANIVYSTLQMHDESEHLLSDLIAYTLQHKMNDMKFRLESNLVGVYLKRRKPGDLERALPLITNLLEIAKNSSPYSRANVELRYAEYLLAKTDYQRSEDIALKSAEVFESVKHPLRYGDAMMMAANASAGRKDWDTSLTHLNKALSVFTDELPADRARVLHRLYEVKNIQGKHLEALRDLEAWVTLNEVVQKKKIEQDFTRASAKLGLSAAKERNEQLEAGNRLKEDLLREEKRKNIYLWLSTGLLFVFSGAMFFGFRQSFRLAESRHRYQRVMEAIDQGILILSEKAEVKSGYSSVLHRFFPRSAVLLNQNFPLLLVHNGWLSEGEAPVLESAIRACIGEHELVWELNQAHLPRVLVSLLHAQQVLEVTWTPVFDSNKNIAEILISIHDISNLRAIENQLQQEKAHHVALGEALHQLIHADPDSCLTFLKSLEVVLTQSDLTKVEGYERFFQQLHLFKGNARGLGLKKIAQQIHHLESLRLQVNAGDSSSHLALQQLEHEVQNLRVGIAKSYDFLKGLPRAHSSNETSVPRSLWSLFDSLSVEIQDLLTSHRLQLGTWQVTAEAGIWSSQLSRIFEPLLRQALLNSIDHGYVRARERGFQSDRFEGGIRASRDKDSVQVEIWDHGIGLDWNMLKKHFMSRGMPELDEEALQELLFQDGVSTARTLSETSGRGLGLAGLRECCRALHGNARLEPLTDQHGRLNGTILRMSILPDMAGLDAVGSSVSKQSA